MVRILLLNIRMSYANRFLPPPPPRLDANYSKGIRCTAVDAVFDSSSNNNQNNPNVLIRVCVTGASQVQSHVT